MRGKKKIAIYTRDGWNASSSYYRVLQYIKELEPIYDVKYRFFVPTWLTKLQYNYKNNLFVKISYHITIIIMSSFYFFIDSVTGTYATVILRSITPKTHFGYIKVLYKKLLLRSTNVIWDFDDDIFLSKEITSSESQLLQKYSSKIFVTHNYLKSKLPEKIHFKVELLPTTDKDYLQNDIDAREYRLSKYSDEIIFCWIGSSASVDYLNLYKNSFEKASKKLFSQKKIRIIIVSNVPFNNFRQNENLIIENLVWTRNVAEQVMKFSHIGIMPLFDGEFEKGKGSFKVIQYMANSLPVIASDVGFNADVIDSTFGFLTRDQDEKSIEDAILKLSTDINFWEKMSKKAHQEWERNYNYQTNLEIWKQSIEAKEL